MTRQTVVLVGNLPFETPIVNRVVQETGWTLEVAESFAELRDRHTSRHPAAVLIAGPIPALSWGETLQAAREACGDALLIVCHRFSDRVNWPDLAEAGAFHSLALPLDANEVRQSLAFAWSAWFRRASRVVAMPHPEARRAGDKALTFASGAA